MKLPFNRGHKCEVNLALLLSLRNMGYFTVSEVWRQGLEQGNLMLEEEEEKKGGSVLAAGGDREEGVHCTAR